MCLSPSLFPLPPLSPTVLEPYLKAKRKTGFNTPARALGAASPAGAPHRPDGHRSSAAPEGGSPQRGPHVPVPRRAPGRADPRRGPTRGFQCQPRPCGGPPLLEGRSSSAPPHTLAAGRRCGQIAEREAAPAALEQRQYDFPRGLRGNYSALTPTPRLFFFFFR